MKKGKKKILIFDLGGVLIDLHVEKSFAAFVAMGADSSLLDESKCVMNDMMQSFDRGDVDSEEFFSYIESFLHVSQACLSSKELRTKVINAWNMMLGSFAHEKLQCLNMLRDRGYRIVMLSNTNEGHWETIEKKFYDVAAMPLDKFFDALYLSYRMHLRKPEPEIFLELLKNEGVMPVDALFIDDSEVNCDVARSVGIEALHIERNSAWNNLFSNII